MLKKIDTVLREYGWLMIFFICLSCTDVKKATYFNGLSNQTISSNTPIPESIIQKSDILSIVITSLNPDASATLNQSEGDKGSEGYLVNSDGFIQIGLLGNIKAEGLTKNQLKEKITTTILQKKLLVDPVVNIRFKNFRITVLGEVNNPTVVSVPNEKISLLEAIGLAGDITLFGKKDNVLVIREEKDQKIIKRINLNSTELFTSPYYYLKSNDIVYVEPTKSRVASTSRATQWIPIVFSGISLALLVYQISITSK
jgi:polysaccharide export outer membrane protein